MIQFRLINRNRIFMCEDEQLLSFVCCWDTKSRDKLYIRTLDALHLVSAADSGFGEILTNDRHMLAAAPHFGLAGRSV